MFTPLVDMQNGTVGKELGRLFIKPKQTLLTPNTSNPTPRYLPWRNASTCPPKHM